MLYFSSTLAKLTGLDYYFRRGVTAGFATGGNYISCFMGSFSSVFSDFLGYYIDMFLFSTGGVVLMTSFLSSLEAYLSCSN